MFKDLNHRAAIGLFCLAMGCQRPEETTSRPAEETTFVLTNRVDIPGPVRKNLGITFAKVEQRAVESTIRVPGRFEWIPTARAEHRAPLRGRIEVSARQYQPVNKGDILFRLDSPDWRDLQRELSDAIAAIDIAQAQLKAIPPIMEAHRSHEQGLRENIELWTIRKNKLEELGSVVANQALQTAEAQSKITEANSALGELEEKRAELELRLAETQSQLRSALAKKELYLTSAAAILGVTLERLTETVSESQADVPYWRTVSQLEIRASIAGVVEQISVTSGTWTEVGALILSVVDPTQIRFRAMGLQSDLDRLQTGLPARILNPSGIDAGENQSIETKLELGLNADPDARTIELLGTPARLTDWTRAGVSGYLEISSSQADRKELAIPLSAVVRDGLASIIFRRDPANPDKAIRMEADLGTNDGRWVVIKSGVRDGDEVVMNGVYQLLLATSGTMQKGGHFHADGTFHEGED